MNSYWVEHAISEKHCETTKSLTICYLFNIRQKKVYRTKISDIDKLKRRINSEWAALSHIWMCSWLVAPASIRASARAAGGHLEHTL